MIIICFLHVKHIVFCFAAAKTSGLALLLSPHGVDLILAWRTGHGAGKIVEGFKEHKDGRHGFTAPNLLEHF